MRQGFRVVHWESEEQFAHFVAEQVGPLMARAGFEEEPEVRTYEVHNILHARSPVGAHR